MASFEDGPDLDRERLPAVVALVRADPRGLALHLGNAIVSLAVRTYRAMIPDACFHEFVSFGFVVEVFCAQN